MGNALACVYAVPMFKVQFRDATHRDKVLVDTMFLPFDPRDQKEVRVRRRGTDARHDTYRAVDHIYEIVVENPAESGIVVFLAKTA